MLVIEVSESFLDEIPIGLPEPFGKPVQHCRDDDSLDNYASTLSHRFLL